MRHWPNGTPVNRFLEKGAGSGNLIEPVFNEVEHWAPRMDFADACAVVLARNYERAFVLTTDFRDFSAYRVPFASPEGAFYL
jgi:predicted nucleic acid-binding protein